MLKKICNGISAGILISIRRGVFLALAGRAQDHRRHLLLPSPCSPSASAATRSTPGASALSSRTTRRRTLSALFLGLLGNAIATIVCGFVLRAAITSMGDAPPPSARQSSTRTFLSTLVRAIFCGILMYVAVGIWRDNKTQLGVVFCIPVFILSGYEHSIADIFYFAASGIVSVRAFAYLWTVILGNTIGAWILPMLEYVWKKDKVNA
jgi:formate/nitrite transporter FocA (FNT family)